MLDSVLGCRSKSEVSPRGARSPGTIRCVSASLFNFRFRLTPWEACLHTNFDRIELADQVGVVCTRDELGIFMGGDPAKNDAMREHAHQFARGLVHAHAYFGFPGSLVMNVEPVGWLEVRDVGIPWTTVTGYMHGSLGVYPLDPDHPDNRPFRQAAATLRAFASNAALYLAMADFHAARREPGPYSAFFAFRALEDVGHMFGLERDKPNWNAMNAAFGTSEETWKRLTEAGTEARHLKSGATGPSSDRSVLLSTSHKAVSLAINHLTGMKAVSGS